MTDSRISHTALCTG